MDVVILVLYGVGTVLGLWALHEDKNIIFIRLFSSTAILKFGYNIRPSVTNC